MNDPDTPEQKLWLDTILLLSSNSTIIPATPIQTAFIETYTQLLTSVPTPRTAAQKVQRLVKSLSDQSNINGYICTLGLLRRGCLILSSHQALVKLVEFTIETEKLCDNVELVEGENWPPVLEMGSALEDGMQGLEVYLHIEN